MAPKRWNHHAQRGLQLEQGLHTDAKRVPELHGVASPSHNRHYDSYDWLEQASARRAPWCERAPRQAFLKCFLAVCASLSQGKTSKMSLRPTFQGWTASKCGSTT